MKKYLIYYLNKVLFMLKPLIIQIMKKPAIVLRVDGGTCSQLNDYIVMRILEEKSGCRVLADYSWYDLNANINNLHSPLSRPQNLENLLEFEPVKEMPKYMLYIYKLLFCYQPEERDLINGGMRIDKHDVPSAPCYLNGYYSVGYKKIAESIWKYCRFRSPEEILDGNMELYRKIVDAQASVGVHVRRGDMAQATGYWEQIPAQYFINVCTDTELKEYTFFLFSEEPDWIEKNICPYLDVKYEISKTNSSYYGYKDLFLLSCCRYQVISQGSFGKYAYIMNKHSDKRFYYYDESQERLFFYSNSVDDL